MLVNEIMSKNVYSADADMTVTEAAQVMEEKNVGGILVKKHGKFIGIVTERDVLRKIAAQGLDPKYVRVADIMTRHLISIDHDKEIEEANHIMLHHNIRRLVVKKDGEIVGILSNRDIARNMMYIIGRNIIEHRDTKVVQDFIENPYL
jgi:CBS domain-containing protein